MKDYLKKSVESYPKFEKETPINPISNIDAEIIVEIIEALKKLNKTDLVTILDGWKYKKDSEVRDDLLQWNIDFNDGDKEDTGEEKKTNEYVWLKKLEGGAYLINGKLYVEVGIVTFIPLNCEKYCLEDIYNYSKIEEWDYDRGAAKYGIRLNEHPDEATFKKRYADKKIFYTSKIKRDSDYDRLDHAFCDQPNIRLVD